MTPLTVVWWGVVVFLSIKLAGLAVNLVLFPRLRAGAVHAGGGRLSLLVPARNEAENLKGTLPGLLAQAADEILILDDGSEDGTHEVLQGLAGHDPRVRILCGAPLPPGWIGKNWACHQLAERATGDLLVFADADVHWGEGALDAIAAEMERQRADAFSVYPRHRTGSIPERALLPIIDDVLLTLLPFPLLSAPVAAAAAGNGQLFAFRREAYEAVGGHAALRDEILEDVRMAQRVRAFGLKLGLALGGTVLGVRMYRSYGDMVGGLAKSLLAAHGGSRLLMAAAAAWHLTVYTLPVVLVFAWAGWALPIAMSVVERILVNRKTLRGSYAEVLLMPIAPVLALPVYARAMGRRRVWKGRSYA